MSQKKKVTNAPLPTAKINDPQKQKMIEDVLEHFDFEKVHKVMTVLNWNYYMDDGAPGALISIPVSEKSVSTGVPSVQYLRDFARGLMMDILSARTTYDLVSCGGFIVSYDARYGELKLDFSVESWTVYSFEKP